MKKLILIITIFVASCKPTSLLTKEDIKSFEIKGDSILYKGEYVAKYLNVEWEYYRGKKS